jgi:lysophospholipase L1-like esterase
VRLEFVGDAAAVDIEYSCASDDLGYRGTGAGTTFSVWRGGEQVTEVVASVDGGTLRLPLGEPLDEVITVYLPEGMRPTLYAVQPIEGTLAPARRGPRWLAYGDSITEGWVASGPANAWPAIAARDYGLDLVNLGYAGAARGEIPSAEQIAATSADVISIAYGTNCWTRTPHSCGQFREGLLAFLAIVRQGHPETSIVVASPVLRPDAEAQPNRLGATLADLRAETEEVVVDLRAAGDVRLTLVKGLPLLSAGQLPDGIHPGDAGHAILAEAIGGAVWVVSPGAIRENPL